MTSNLSAGALRAFLLLLAVDFASSCLQVCRKSMQVVQSALKRAFPVAFVAGWQRLWRGCGWRFCLQDVRE